MTLADGVDAAYDIVAFDPQTVAVGALMPTTAGRTLYKLRQQTVEPIFGIIKEAMGFRRFSLRGHAKVSLEWNLVCLAYNLKRLHIVGANLRAA